MCVTRERCHDNTVRSEERSKNSCLYFKIASSSYVRSCFGTLFAYNVCTHVTKVLLIPHMLEKHAISL